MQKGALVYKTFEGNTPFHLAAVNGHTHCMNVIFGIDPCVLNLKNKKGVSLSFLSFLRYAFIFIF
jgi:ankyrin repeat protein